MRAMTRATRSRATRSRATRGGVIVRLPVLAAGVLAAALVLPAVSGPAPAHAATAAPNLAAGSCYYRPVPGGYQLVCTNNSGTPGAPGTGGSAGSAKSACTLTPLSQQQVKFLGLPWPAPAGHSWDAITCPGTQPFGGVTLVNNATGAPAVTPQQLAQIAIGELIIPLLQPQTAPPRGQDGLVGLPEWFWVPRAEWGPISRTVTAGPVWARATAVPVRIVFNPGGGRAGTSCRGPGTAYQPSLPLSGQHTGCSYTYDRPSAGQPGHAYAVTVTVLWNVFWVGSGNTGGPVANGRPVSTPLTLPVAAGEALVTGR
jgi:hypothetical protein